MYNPKEKKGKIMKKRINLTAVSEKIFTKYGVEYGIVLICSHTAAELVNII